MSALFPKWINRLPFILVLFGAGGAVGAIGLMTYYFSPEYTDVGYQPDQPVPYSHKLHAGTLGMDCRYCHTGVEESDHAFIPPSQTCMNCHEVIKPESELLLPVRLSYAQNVPVEWIRVHDLPDYTHFNHAVHVAAGVGCTSCHGRVDQMEIIRQVETLSMDWCLDCHRNPAPHLRPRDKVTVMDYQVDEAEGRKLVEQNKINPPVNCSACHY